LARRQGSWYAPGAVQRPLATSSQAPCSGCKAAASSRGGGWFNSQMQFDRDPACWEPQYTENVIWVQMM